MQWHAVDSSCAPLGLVCSQLAWCASHLRAYSMRLQVRGCPSSSLMLVSVDWPMGVQSSVVFFRNAWWQCRHCAGICGMYILVIEGAW